MVLKILGYPLGCIGYLFVMVLRFALFLGLCVYIGLNFVDTLGAEGFGSALLNAVIALVVGGFIAWILFMIFSWIGVGLVAVGGGLVERAEKREEEKEYARSYVPSPPVVSEAPTYTPSINKDIERRAQQAPLTQQGITCSDCGALNAPNQPFCGACGARLATHCIACGSSATPGYRFCGTCGARLDWGLQQQARYIPSWSGRVYRLYEEEPKHNGKAIASMVLGIIGLVAWLSPFFGVPITVTGLVLGIVGLRSSRQGMAIAGIIMCIIELGLLAIGTYFAIVSWQTLPWQGSGTY